MKISIFVRCIFLVSCLFVNCKIANGQLSKKLSKNLTKIQLKSNLPGFSVAILREDSLLFSEGFGYTNEKLKSIYTPETIQPIGSVSKTFIGFAVMKAIDLGYFNLETDINTILPFKIVNPNFENEPIKIKHLVTHTSGLVDNDSVYFKAYNLGKLPTVLLAEYLKSYYLKDGKFYFTKNFANSKPGTNYSYSNIASALTAYLIEIKANMTFADFTKEYIFKPLGMNSSHWFYDETLAPKYATLYEVNKPFDPNFKDFINNDGSVKPYALATYPDGSLRTSASDLSKYLKEMQKGLIGKSNLLLPNSYKLLFQKQFSEMNMPTNMPASEPNIAVFWGFNKKGKLMHTGSDPGLSTFVSMDPATNICRILLFNTSLSGENNAKTLEHFKKIIVEIKYDAVLIGAGIMSATLGVLLKELFPKMSIGIFERLDKVASESSDAWNNAGTGHSAFCELNYTPENEADGNIDISKAIKIASQFEESKQFWTYLVENKVINNPEKFISNIPHLSFVWGESNVKFLKKRYELLTKNSLFKGMKYSENTNTLAIWMPLVMKSRPKTEKVAATFMEAGTDINFGALTNSLIEYLDHKIDDVDVHLNHEIQNITDRQNGNVNSFLKKLNKKYSKVEEIKATDNHKWELEIEDLTNGEMHNIYTNFVFIGAGGGALPLLEKSDIEEAEGYGGFPISGQWLKCANPEIIAQHHTKVYGKASLGSPPMSVPHLDSRMIGGKKELLFGPFAGFSTKFLKKGSYLDLPKSIELDNIIPMILVGINNLGLTKYLIDQVRQKPIDRLNALKEYFPEAKMEDWELIIAGQRVQVIKKDEEEGGVLEFGTELITAADGSLAALLGASPGASTAVSIMIKLIKTSFHSQFESADFQAKLREMIPSYGKSLENEEELLKIVRKKSEKILKLD
jgi:malate dehydrogenase (quinone)